MNFSPRAAELTTLLENRMTNFYTNFQVDEIGRVVSVGDGIARVYGLNEIQAGEMVEFASGVKGIALNLEILPLIPMNIGDFYFSFTNPSLFMLLTLTLILLAIVIRKMEGASPSAKSRKRKSLSSATGGASGSGEGDDDDNRHRKKAISAACQANFIRAARELLIEVYVASGGAHEGLLKNPHSNRWNWALKTILEEQSGTLSKTFQGIYDLSSIMGELASKGPDSPFFKRTIELLKEVEK